ncbi:DUF1684 domain-containing protein [Halopenitus persicus]|uniref:DUF1684 domain-containing protein n=1 Tax=Halopenitus persicus TaxID=1048396 RepID=UPI000BBB11F5|nr:DUF1684 domain-containing protein [Halopenitus persicus]
MTDDYVRRVQESRAEKDEFFGDHPQSPIPPERRDSFDGLAYFDPAPDYRVPATVTVHDDPEPLELETTAGPNVRYLRVVTFAFELHGTDLTLAAYRQEGEPDAALFVPFRDKTTGQETYHNGRYIELEPDGELDDGDEVTIDFNLAYNPFCAYTETFSCPLPPEENWLEVAVYAGERTPPW